MCVCGGAGGRGVSCLPPPHPQPPARKPPGGRAEIDLTASWEEGRAGRFLPLDAQRGPSPAAGDFPGRARFSGELLPRGRIELPLGCGSPAPPPPTSHWGVRGQDPEWVALKSPLCARKRIRWPRRRARLDSPGGTRREAGSGAGGRGWRGAGDGSSGAGPPPLHLTLLLPPCGLGVRSPGVAGSSQSRSQPAGGGAAAFPAPPAALTARTCGSFVLLTATSPPALRQRLAAPLLNQH